MRTLRIYRAFRDGEPKEFGKAEQCWREPGTLLDAHYNFPVPGYELYCADVPDRNLQLVRGDLVMNMVDEVIMNWVPIPDDDPKIMAWRITNLETQMRREPIVTETEDQTWALFEVEK